MNKFQVCVLLLSLAVFVSAEEKSDAKGAADKSKRSYPHAEGSGYSAGLGGYGHGHSFGGYEGHSLGGLGASSYSSFGSGLGSAYGGGYGGSYGSGYGAGYAAPAAYSSHGYVPTAVRVNTVNERVAVPRPYPVPVSIPRAVPYSVPQPYPVDVPRPVPHAVPVPQPYPVDKPYPVVRERPVPQPIPVPQPYKVIERVPVPVPHPVPVDATPYHHAPIAAAPIAVEAAPISAGPGPFIAADSAVSTFSAHAIEAAPAYASSFSHGAEFGGASYAPHYSAPLAHHAAAPCHH